MTRTGTSERGSVGQRTENLRKRLQRADNRGTAAEQPEPQIQLARRTRTTMRVARQPCGPQGGAGPGALPPRSPHPTGSDARGGPERPAAARQQLRQPREGAATGTNAGSAGRSHPTPR